MCSTTGGAAGRRSGWRWLAQASMQLTVPGCCNGQMPWIPWRCRCPVDGCWRPRGSGSWSRAFHWRHAGFGARRRSGSTCCCCGLQKVDEIRGIEVIEVITFRQKVSTASDSYVNLGPVSVLYWVLVTLTNTPVATNKLPSKDNVIGDIIF